MARNAPLPPDAWGLAADESGRLLVEGVPAVELARTYGTPLHLLNLAHLEESARQFRRAFAANWPGAVDVHYALKCNSVPAVLEAVRRAGLKAEVMTPFELDLALRVGYRGADLIANGPCKTPAFLYACIAHEVGLVVIDALEELEEIEALGRGAGRAVDVLLRVNPDIVPRGMNAGSATGSRRNCAFGLDLVGGEVLTGLRALDALPHVRFRGLHMHVGTGIRDPKDYARAVASLAGILEQAAALGRTIEVLDVGGGFATPTTRELNAREMITSQVLRRAPRLGRRTAPPPEAFAAAIVNAVEARVPRDRLPRLVVEPGRSIASQCQCLLLGVHRVKRRPGVGTWIVTDGGLGTVTMPTYYEVHEVLLADDVRRPRTERATVIGPACFAGDVVVRGKRLPEVRPGETLAVMDSGAYFTALESSFGFPRSAVVAVRDGRVRLARRRETFEDMRARDAVASAPDSPREV